MERITRWTYMFPKEDDSLPMERTFPSDQIRLANHHDLNQISEPSIQDLPFIQLREADMLFPPH